MKKDIIVETKRELLTLVGGVTYSVVPAWYGATYRNLKMNVIMPRNSKGHAPQPCLLFLCGGAFSNVNDGVWLPELMYFAQRGYTVATIEYRTSNTDTFPAPLIDAKAAVRFLKAHAQEFSIDPARIAIAGESAGGTLCSLVGTTAGMPEYEQGAWLEYDSTVAAVVDYYGSADMIARGRSDDRAHGKDRHKIDWTVAAFLGPGYTEEEAKKASLVYTVNENTPPFIILHGTDDPLVNIAEHSDRLYEKLTEKGIYTEYYRFVGHGHGEPVFYQDEAKELVLNFLEKVWNGEAK